MRSRVRWAGEVADATAELYGPERSAAGRPSEYDFASGPLAAAAARFTDFDSLPEVAGAAVRSVHLLDPVFGPVVFVGVLMEQGVVEIAGFTADPDCWRQIDDDPDE